MLRLFRNGFQRRPGPVVVVVADGVGVATPDPSNAVTAANTPVIDQICSGPFYRELFAHGTHVGLPSDNDIGNSEVGHNALGAGRIFDQGAKLVNKAIADETLFESDLWQSAVQQASDATLHFIGLHSDGIVHSDIEHLHSLLRRAAAEGVAQVRVHSLLDGRDVQARSAVGYIEQTESLLQQINHQNADSGVQYSIASGGGRMVVTMDRYEADWDMVERGYHLHVNGAGRPFHSAIEAVETLYAESDKGDQYLDPFVVVDQSGEPIGKIADGDVVILYNFRGDRAIEISQAFEDPDFEAFDRGNHPEILFLGMLQYDGDAMVPKKYLVEPPLIERTLSDYLCAENLASFAVSETQKFGHVTFFWNGNKSGYINSDLETYVEIPSDNVEFNKTPAMKFKEITEETIKLINSGEVSFGRINYPNGDMVGHTGDLAATVEAMECIEQGMKDLMEAVQAVGGVLLFTADHGNADVMYREVDGVRSPVTSHTLSPVPFAIYDPAYNAEYQMSDVPDASLGNVAATVCNLLGYHAPEDYNESLITFTKSVE